MVKICEFCCPFVVLLLLHVVVVSVLKPNLRCPSWAPAGGRDQLCAVGALSWQVQLLGSPGCKPQSRVLVLQHSGGEGVCGAGIDGGGATGTSLEVKKKRFKSPNMASL